ncbi:response regulator transcription factor [Buttiauxella sp. B2]|uniref:helix-turn-helix domain-containing protein n=1 Tax=Buttiauxella sp. B2 TaxID=2587812 RepID=UPI00111E9AEF|nr:LuxR C-terminal-related transcriptional regulator [Buttiauxella sp. B2]TNV20050.1 response regulator transcription factor [Buttiauxella sp. B2]
MQESKARIFLRNPFCRVVAISKRPLMREGLQFVMEQKATRSSLVLLEDYLELKSEIMANVDVVMVELDRPLRESFDACGFINHLQNQYRQVQWIFTLPTHLVTIAVEYLLTNKTSLLSLYEPMSSIIEHIFDCDSEVERISSHLLQEKAAEVSTKDVVRLSLTFAERRVLRLLSKGWQLTQIAALLGKNYKTISAQKSSALRRLALKTDAEMYAWMISENGMKELNFPPCNLGI